MEKNVLKNILLFFLLGIGIIFTSCDLFQPEASVFMGNTRYTQGQFSDATIYYLEGLESGEYNEWIWYNLGTVYYVLGEPVSALQIWDQAQDTDSSFLKYRLFVNRGILFYRRGEFPLAFDSFRTALLANPSGIEAKINLELTLVKLQAQQVSYSSDTEEVSENNQDAGAQRMLEYVRRKEALVWEPGNTPTEYTEQNDW